METILYTSPSCPKCTFAKQILDSKNIKYSVCMDAEQALAAGVSTLPTLSLNGELMAFPAIVAYCKGGEAVV